MHLITDTQRSTNSILTYFLWIMLNIMDVNNECSIFQRLSGSCMVNKSNYKWIFNSELIDSI